MVSEWNKRQFVFGEKNNRDKNVSGSQRKLLQGAFYLLAISGRGPTQIYALLACMLGFRRPQCLATFHDHEIIAGVKAWRGSLHSRSCAFPLGKWHTNRHDALHVGRVGA